MAAAPAGPSTERKAPPSVSDKNPGSGSLWALSDPSTTHQPTVHQDVVAILQLIVSQTKTPVSIVASPDELLERGIGDYTFIPGGVLGRGKFSNVYVVKGRNGKEYALKHTPLHPHHPLISLRLLREPTLLAQLPPHPSLIPINEFISTPAHFYLIETFLPRHITLDALCLLYPGNRLPLSLIRRIMRQLASVVKALHENRVAHRDIKPENVLIEPETGDTILLDFGLATRFSMSEARLTTCCGSPAYHCPEIVLSLSLPPGSVTYYGPELDIWCLALSVLRCLTGRRYPLGTNHVNLKTMAIRVDQVLADVYDREIRDILRGWLDMDGVKRWQKFQIFEVGREEKERVESWKGRGRDFKTTTFAVAQPKHTLHLIPSTTNPNPLGIPSSPSVSSHMSSPKNIPSGLVSAAGAASGEEEVITEDWDKAVPDDSKLWLKNPTGESPGKVVSFLKYALRCANILYHCRAVKNHDGLLDSPKANLHHMPSSMSPLNPPLPSADTYGDYDVFQCVAILPKMPDPPPGPPVLPTGLSRFPSYLASAFKGGRSSSTPPVRRAPSDENAQTQKRSISTGRKNKEEFICLVFFMVLKFPHNTASQKEIRRRSRSRRRSLSRAAGDRDAKTQSRLFHQSEMVEEEEEVAQSPGRSKRLGSNTSSTSESSTSSTSTASGTDTSTATTNGGYSSTGSTAVSNMGSKNQFIVTSSLVDLSPVLETPPSPAMIRPSRLMEIQDKSDMVRDKTVVPTSRAGMIRSSSSSGLGRSNSASGLHRSNSKNNTAPPNKAHHHHHHHHHRRRDPSAQRAEPLILCVVSDPLAIESLKVAFQIGIPPITPSEPVDIKLPVEDEEEPRRGRLEARSSDSNPSTIGMTHSSSSTSTKKKSSGLSVRRSAASGSRDARDRRERKDHASSLGISDVSDSETDGDHKSASSRSQDMSRDGSNAGSTTGEENGSGVSSAGGGLFEGWVGKGGGSIVPQWLDFNAPAKAPPMPHRSRSATRIPF